MSAPCHLGMTTSLQVHASISPGRDRARETPVQQAAKVQNGPVCLLTLSALGSRMTPQWTTGQAYRSYSSRLYASIRPVPSNHSTLIRSARLAPKT